ncbi:DNRLRE domain-containing protein [Haloechinothrix sp. YIM 98757]|uniref:DNRLRE domain-containing protein n=1 Tax=Haloechinothrix aidingensis TaxID=2752311 RepID=A0A838AAB6_9PSEU|nr:DNRLRE domain-containing protein [Haloechinothrix aidingensis]MBA0126091.1 DNRLRE domain-containing protein [Haloechinothrix aidingensis]
MNGYVFAEEPGEGEGGQAEPGEMSGAAVVKDGWWWALNETPEDDTGFVPQEPPPSNVPEGAIPVAAAGGDREKISAIEFALEARPGAEMRSATLALRESEESGANVNEEDAVVRACQITESFWADEEAAAWETRPEVDCEAGSAEGIRDEDGTWTFDLTSLASSWVAEDGETPQSIMLVAEAESAESFQVAYEGLDHEAIGITVDAEGGSAPGGAGGGDAEEIGESVAGAPDAAGAPAEEAAPAAPGSDDEAAVAAGDGEIPEDAEAPVTSADGGSGNDPDLAAGPAQPSVYDGIPWAAWLLVPAALGVAYIAMLALGPRGEPTTGSSGHGVSRALQRWSRGGPSAAGGT